jgi:hypothetical protein
MLAGSRGWIDRLVGWRVLQPSMPNRLARLQLHWALCVLPLLVVSWSRAFQLAALPLPSIFSGADEVVNFPSALVFVLENLVHTQIFVDTFEVYGMRIADLHQQGFAGGLLTFLLRLVLNVGVIALLVSLGMVWFNWVFRKFPVSPNAELTLRQEVYECGPHAAMLVGYHLREVRDFLMDQIKKQKDEAMLVALAASGFFKDVQEEQDSSEPADDLAGMRADLGFALSNQGRLEEAVVEYKAARDIYERLVHEGRDDLRENLARTRMNLAVVLRKQGHLEEAIAEYDPIPALLEFEGCHVVALPCPDCPDFVPTPGPVAKGAIGQRSQATFTILLEL